MKNSFLFLILLFSVLSCTKFDAGTGGKAKIHVKVIDGNTNVPEATVKVIYNTREYPGADANYDNEKTADVTGLASFENLRRGDYYFYSYINAKDSSGADIIKEGGAYCRIASKVGETHVVIDYSEDNPY